MKAYPLHKLYEIYNNLYVKAKYLGSDVEGEYTNFHYEYFELIYRVTFRSGTIYRITSDPDPKPY